MLIFKFLRNLFLAIVTLSLTVFADTKNADQVSVTMSPTSPIIILAPYIYSYVDPELHATNSIEINGPWVHFSLAVNNTSDQPVTIVSSYFIATNGDHSYGQAFGPENLLPPVSPTPMYLAQIPAHSASAPIDVWLQSLPVSGTGFDTQTVDSVVGQIQGWTGTFEVPIEKFVKTINFVTQ